MNKKLSDHIESFQRTKGFTTRLGFDTEKTFMYLHNFAWGILLCVFLSFIVGISFYMLLALNTLFYVLGTGLYKYQVPKIHIKEVNISDFNGVNLSIDETEEILSAQRKHLKYKEFFKDINKVAPGYFVV